MEQGKSKQIKLGIGISIAITAIVGFFLYYKIKNKEKQSQQKQKVEVEQEPESQEEEQEIEEQEKQSEKSELKEKQLSPQKENIQESQKIEAFAQSWVEVDKSVQIVKEKVDLNQEPQNQTKQTEKTMTQEVKPQEENKQSEKPQTDKSVQKTPQKSEKQSSKTPSKQPPKIIPKNTLLNIFIQVKKVFPQKLQELRKNSREKRKQFFNKDWESYKKVVQEYLIQSQMLDDQILSETLKQFQVTQTEFDNAIDAYVQDEEVKQMVKTVFAASMITEVSIPQELNENELEKILNFQVTKLQELAQDAKKWGDMNVLLFIVQDQVEQQFGYKEEEVNMALKNFTEMNPQRFQHFYERMETINTMFMMYGKEQSSQLLNLNFYLCQTKLISAQNTKIASNILNFQRPIAQVFIFV